MLSKLFKFLLFDKRDKRQKVTNDTGSKIPRILWDVLKAANIEKINKFLQLGLSKALKAKYNAIVISDKKTISLLLKKLLP